MILSENPLPKMRTTKHRDAFNTVKTVIDKREKPFNYMYKVITPTGKKPKFFANVGMWVTDKRLSELGDFGHHYIHVNATNSGIAVKSGISLELYEDGDLPEKRKNAYRKLAKKKNCAVQFEDTTFKEWNKRGEEIEGFTPATLITATCYSPSISIPYSSITEESVMNAIGRGMKEWAPKRDAFLELTKHQ